MADKNYTTIPFPAARQIVVDAGRMGTRRHIIHGLLELDVTCARQFMRKHKEKTGESLSFTAFLISCLAHAIQAFPLVQAYRNWRNQLILFNESDIVTMIETEAGGVALPHIIRASNRKSFQEIHDEIRAVQAQPARSPQTTVLAKWGARLPRFMRDGFYWIILKNPHWLKKYAGTAVVTSIGMFGRGAGWGVGFLPMHTLGLTIGGIVERPALLDGQLVLREYLCITISFDHDIVDGAPAARFTHRLKELIESGYGLGNQ